MWPYHYNYCAVCQSVTLHHYEMAGVRWEHCDEHIDMSVVIDRLEQTMRGRL